MKINVNCHSSIQIENVFFDPYKIKNCNIKAKYVFLTHTHYDHLSIEDIKVVSDEKTAIIATFDAKNALETTFEKNKLIFVKPNESYNIEDIEFETFPSYNVDKAFHKKENGWVGYKILIDGQSIIICGDTDATKELQNQSCDILFVPIGGTYTMNAEEAAVLTNTIKPKVAIPVHYGEIVGEKKLGKTFKNLVNPNIDVRILIK